MQHNMADPTATPRTFTEEELSRMDPLVRESILAALAIINATPTPTPTPRQTPPITRVSGPAPKATPKVVTPTPATGKGKAVRRGRWIEDIETGEKVYEGEPRFNELVNKYGASANSVMGID